MMKTSPNLSGSRSPAAPRQVQRIESPALMQAASMALRRSLSTIGFVPTMGALHDAHLALMREARRRCDVLVVSIFVNPRQFDDESDLDAYPRQLERDLVKCESVGVDIVFCPDAEYMYPFGFDTTLHVDSLSREFEGASRPGHFDGMCTVVTKLFNLVRPHFAVFGEKDFQQLQIVRRLVADLSLPVEIVGMPVLREIDGLAMSSRNLKIPPEYRDQAPALFRAIEAAQKASEQGEFRAPALIQWARAELQNRPDVHEDYIAIVAPQTLQSLLHVDDEARILVAARLGPVRLIDNGPIYAQGAQRLS